MVTNRCNLSDFVVTPDLHWIKGGESQGLCLIRGLYSLSDSGYASVGLRSPIRAQIKQVLSAWRGSRSAKASALAFWNDARRKAHIHLNSPLW